MLQLSRPPHGLLVRSDLLAAGISRHTWWRAVDQGVLDEIMPGVAVVTGRTVTAEMRLSAAVLSVGDGAVLSHRSAAWAWGVDGLAPTPIDVTRTQRTQRLAVMTRPDVVLHRPTDVADLQPVTVRDLLVTSPVRTLLDLGAVAPKLVDRALTHFRVTRQVTIDDVHAAIAQHSAKGRAGIGALRRAVDAQQLDGMPPDSVLEERMARLARRFRLPKMVFHHRLCGYEVDFWIVDSCLYLECDGWAAHGLQRNQFEFDRRRTAELSAAGLVGMRMTWRQIVTRPQEVADLVLRNVERWAPHLLTPVLGRRGCT